MKIIITAGGTSEHIDTVRKITNSSSGKLGTLIANQILAQKYSEIDVIYYICSKNAYKPTDEKVKVLIVETVEELKNIVEELLNKEKIDYFIHSMAVSDYTVDYVSNAKLLADYIRKHNEMPIEEAIRYNENRISNDSKVSSQEDNLIIKLKPTPKIISIIKKLSPSTFLVGFKLLTDVTEEKLKSVALRLKESNNCDIVVANDLQTITSGTHRALILDGITELIANSKEEIALKLVNKIFR